MRTYLTSVARIAHFNESPYRVESLDRSRWATGDYVVVEVSGLHGLRDIELENGRKMELGEGDQFIGALGIRSATLEATGSWEDVEEDGRMHLLTSGGLLGKCRSRSAFIPELMSVTYRGHVIRGLGKTTMTSVLPPIGYASFTVPVILVLGTSMSAGKTTASRSAIRLLAAERKRIIGAKLAGAARYRDILSMYDAGAHHIFDFVDAGMPSTILEESAYRDRLDHLLNRMGAVAADVAVVEIGASPLEPYNGRAAFEAIREQVCFVLLAATDPYAVMGVESAFMLRPDLVTGIAANTDAGVNLVKRLTGIPAMNLREKESLPALRLKLLEALGAPLTDEPEPVVFY